MPASENNSLKEIMNSNYNNNLMVKNKIIF